MASGLDRIYNDRHTLKQTEATVRELAGELEADRLLDVELKMVPQPEVDSGQMQRLQSQSVVLQAELEEARREERQANHQGAVFVSPVLLDPRPRPHHLPPDPACQIAPLTFQWHDFPA